MTSPFDWKTNRGPSDFAKSKDFTSIARAKLAKRPVTSNGMVDPKLETPCPIGFAIVPNSKTQKRI